MPPSQRLTERQNQVYEFLRSYMRVQGRAPFQQRLHHVAVVGDEQPSIDQPGHFYASGPGFIHLQPGVFHAPDCSGDGFGDRAIRCLDAVVQEVPDPEFPDVDFTVIAEGYGNRVWVNEIRTLHDLKQVSQIINPPCHGAGLAERGQEARFRQRIAGTRHPARGGLDAGYPAEVGRQPDAAAGIRADIEWRAACSNDRRVGKLALPKKIT